MNILFTGFYFDGYHGSMMHVCEIAKYLSSKGHKCYCAALSIKKEVKKYAKSIGLDVYNVVDLPIDIEYDIVWAYHFPLFPYLLDKGLKYKKVHVGCLGLISPLEVPSVLYKECNLLSVMCQRTKDILVADYGIDENDVYVLKNLLPDEFYNTYVSLSSVPQRVAVVSNHPPPRSYWITVIFTRREGWFLW